MQQISQMFEIENNFNQWENFSPGGKIYCENWDASVQAEL